MPASPFLTRGIRRVPALEASLLLLLEPVSNGLLTWAVHGEQPGSFALGGSALILAATAARVAMRESRSPALR